MWRRAATYRLQTDFSAITCPKCGAPVCAGWTAADTSLTFRPKVSHSDSKYDQEIYNKKMKSPSPPYCYLYGFCSVTSPVMWLRDWCVSLQPRRALSLLQPAGLQACASLSRILVRSAMQSDTVFCTQTNRPRERGSRDPLIPERQRKSEG